MFLSDRSYSLGILVRRRQAYPRFMTADGGLAYVLRRLPDPFWLHEFLLLVFRLCKKRSRWLRQNGVNHVDN